MKSDTGLIHDPYTPPKGFEAPMPGVFKASTVFFPNVKAMRERRWMDKSSYTYGLHGTPTTYALEERIAHLEGGRYCALTPSGLAAIALVDLALLHTGDHLLLPDNVYGPSRETAEGLLKKMGITYALYDPMQPASLRAALTPNTKLVWLEAPGSVTMEFPPLDELAQIAHEARALTALDNTWAAGLALCGFELGEDTHGNAIGVDIVMQALTKYPSGGGDVLMGSVVTRDPSLHRMLQRAHMHMGIGVSGNDAETLLRSLPTLSLRYKAQFEQARSLAQWCEKRTEFSAVLYPALAKCPGYAHWKRLCGDCGAGLFSVILDERYALEQVDRFVDALRLFKIGYSWGGPISLVMPYDLRDMRDEPTYKGILVRFSLGFEAQEDLRDDLAQALAKLV